MKKTSYMIIVLTTILFLSLIISCSTRYQPNGMLDGYSAEKVIDNLYRVEYKGNQHSSPGDVNNHLMYRCAELTKEMGYEYFAIVSQGRPFDKNRYFSSYYRIDVPQETNYNTQNNISIDYTESYIIRLLEKKDLKYTNLEFRASHVLYELSNIVKK